MASQSETITLHSPHSRPLHIQGVGMLIPGANAVDAGAWDRIKNQPQVKELGIREERRPATTLGREEKDAVELVRATLDIRRIEAMQAAETRPTVLAALGEQRQKLFVPLKAQPDTRSPVDAALSVPAQSSQVGPPVAAPVAAPVVAPVAAPVTPPAVQPQTVTDQSHGKNERRK